MQEDISARQRALVAIWSSQGPDELMEIMVRLPAARGGDIADELRKEAERAAIFNPDLSERLGEMANAVQSIGKSVDEFTRVESIRDLLALRKKYPLSWSAKFSRILGALWRESQESKDLAKQTAFRRAFGVVKGVNVAVHLITKLPSQEPEQWASLVETFPLLCDPSFHELLDERFSLAAQNKDASAEVFAQMSSYVRDACKVVRAVQQWRTDSDEKETRVRLPLNSDRAELWFLFSEEFTLRALKIARELNAGKKSLSDAIEEILTIAPEYGNGTKEAGETFFSAAFLEHLLREPTVSVLREAMECYRRLVDTGQWDSEEARATFVLRFAKASLNHWRNLSNPRQCLQDGSKLISAVLPVIDPAQSPRLMRDLFFSRARILENIGIWEPAAYVSAAQDYAIGLDVPKVKHELEARGAALTDYANTLTRFAEADPEEHDRKIIRVYEEALACLSSQDRTASRSLALNSYAAYLNTRIYGDHAANQERALAMAQEAIDIIEKAISTGRLDPNNAHLLRTLASAYLTKSNVIRARDFGDRHGAYVAALDSLRSGLSRLGTTPDDQLRGILKLNLADVHVEFYAMTGKVSEAQNALYAYEEAEALLEPYPKDFSHALLSRAMLVTEVPECRTPEAVQASLDAAHRAAKTLAHSDDHMAYGRALFCLGELLFFRGHSGEAENAAESFDAACHQYLEAGNRINAVMAARRFAAVRVEQFKQGESIGRVALAKQRLRDAGKWIDELWRQFDSVDWRYMISDRFADVYAEMAWCQATLGDPIEELAVSLSLAKSREFTAHVSEVGRSAEVGGILGEYLDQLRVESRVAERGRWRAQRSARPDGSLNEEMQESQKSLDQLAFRRRMFVTSTSHDTFPSPLASIRGFIAAHPLAVICDLTTCRWGTIALLAAGEQVKGVSGLCVRVLAVEGTTIIEWMIGWSSAYSAYLSARSPERASARKSWAEETDELLQALAEQVVQPVLDGLNVSEAELVIVPGRLAGLPLHAARLASGDLLVDAFASVVYAANVVVLSSDIDKVDAPVAGLCVVSDPRKDLAMAASECSAVSAFLCSMGTKVEVLAGVGDTVGAEAFVARGIQPPDATILESAPSPEAVSKLLPDCDHFFYSGHGTGTGGQSALVLVDEKASERLFSQDEVLALPALRRHPVVVLSACETAIGGQASSELFDLTSSFLRVGASFVVGSLWVVVEAAAMTFTGAFYAALAGGESPSSAFGRALRVLKKHRGVAHVDDSSVPLDHPIYWAPFIAMRGR